MVQEDGALLDSTVGVMVQAVATESRNMILIPSWHAEPEDTCIKRLVDAMLNVYKDVSAAVDVTTLSQSVTAALTSPVTHEAGPGLATETTSTTQQAAAT